MNTPSIKRPWLTALRWVAALAVLALVGASYGQIDLLVNWVAKFC